MKLMKWCILDDNEMNEMLHIQMINVDKQIRAYFFRNFKKKN